MPGLGFGLCCCNPCAAITRPDISFDACPDRFHFLIFDIDNLNGCAAADYGTGDQYGLFWVSTDATWRTFERPMTPGVRTVSVQIKTSVELDGSGYPRYVSIRINDGTYGTALDTVAGQLVRVDYPGYTNCGCVLALQIIPITSFRIFEIGAEPASVTMTFAGVTDGFGSGCSAFNDTVTLDFVSSNVTIDGYSWQQQYQGDESGLEYTQHNLGSGATTRWKNTTCFQTPSSILWSFDCSVTARTVDDDTWDASEFYRSAGNAATCCTVTGAVITSLVENP